jgi:SSS family solute:Na+ symporter
VDILAKLRLEGKNELAVMRLVTLGVILAALAILLLNLDAAIMKWSFLSMGLRGATLCLPLLATIFLREKTTPRGGALSIYLAPIVVIITGIIGTTFPPLLIGLAASGAIMLLGMAVDRRV